MSLKELLVPAVRWSDMDIEVPSAWTRFKRYILKPIGIFVLGVVAGDLLHLLWK
jgi:hypothetical protein